MENNDQKQKFDISSTAVEKGLDLAKGFVDKLVNPSIEELGLLIKDQVSYWRFSNQVKILNKAKILCEKNNIETKAISPKLLCPYLENASLEDDDELQDKWAILLMNMVDSKQNIQNHVFPYILSQLSKSEFNILDSTLTRKQERISRLEIELHEFLTNREEVENKLKNSLDVLKKQCSESDLLSERADLKSKIRSTEHDIRMINYRDSMLKRKISKPESITGKGIEEFEIANIVRLGLAKVTYEANSGSHTIEIPANERDEYTSVDFDVDIDMDVKTILTELGELFINACRDQSNHDDNEV